jgi:hypothetical protein
LHFGKYIREWGSPFKRLIRIGRLTVIEADGTVIVCGEAAIGQPDVVVQLTGPLTSLKLALWPDLYLGEAYMAGELVIERGSVARQMRQYNPIRVSRETVVRLIIVLNKIDTVDSQDLATTVSPGS